MTSGDTGLESRSLGEPLAETGDKMMYLRFVLAVMSALPWVGSAIAAGTALSAELEQKRVNAAHRAVLNDYGRRLRDLEESASRVVQRVDGLGEEARERLNSEEFLGLVRRAYRGWDRAQTEEKRLLFERLLSNAAGTRVSSDDLVRLFIDWIDRYDEVHFRVISAVYRSRGLTRLGIWREIGSADPLPREDSSEADLFRMLIHDLSTGRVIRQERAVSPEGRFLKRSRRGSRGPASPYMKSSFDDEERYELSELGAEFVHYVLTDTVTRIDERRTQ